MIESSPRSRSFGSPRIVQLGDQITHRGQQIEWMATGHCGFLYLKMQLAKRF